MSSLRLASSTVFMRSLRLRGASVGTLFSCSTCTFVPPSELTLAQVVGGGGIASGATLRRRAAGGTVSGSTSRASVALTFSFALDLYFAGSKGAFFLPLVGIVCDPVTARARFACFFASGTSESSESLPSTFSEVKHGFGTSLSELTMRGRESRVEHCPRVRMTEKCALASASWSAKGTRWAVARGREGPDMSM